MFSLQPLRSNFLKILELWCNVGLISSLKRKKWHSRFNIVAFREEFSPGLRQHLWLVLLSIYFIQNKAFLFFVQFCRLTGLFQIKIPSTLCLSLHAISGRNYRLCLWWRQSTLPDVLAVVTERGCAWQNRVCRVLPRPNWEAAALMDDACVCVKGPLWGFSGARTLDTWPLNMEV